MKIAVAGTGYVGLSIVTLLAQHNEVTAVDIIPAKVEMINNRKSPIQDATLCADCRQARREKAKQWLITAGKVAAGIAVVVGAAVLAASATENNEDTNYTPLPEGDDEGEKAMKFNHVTDSWMQSASEDELRSVENEMRSALDNIDYDSDEYLQLDLKRIDVVNTIASRFPLNLPHREHGWYLPNDDD